MIPNIEARKFKEDITMGMVVQHNMNALNAYNKLNTNVAGLKKSSEKLSSGYRINRAGDDAAGLAISEKMRSQIRGLTQAKRNSQDGISMIQTFEGATQESHSILQRMKELASESANGTYQDEVDRDAIQLEFDQLNDELDQIADTDFNGVTMLNGGQMADGTRAVGGKVDYTSDASKRNAISLSGSDFVVGNAKSNITTDETVTFTYSDNGDGTGSWTQTGGTDANLTSKDNGGFQYDGIVFSTDTSKLVTGDTVTINFKQGSAEIKGKAENGGYTFSGVAKDPFGAVTVGTEEPSTKADADTINALQGATISFTTDNTGAVKASTAGQTVVTLADGTKIAHGTAATAANKYAAQTKADGSVEIYGWVNGASKTLFTIAAAAPSADNKDSNGELTLSFAEAVYKAEDKGGYEIMGSNTVSKANSNEAATAPLTYTDHLVLQTGARTKDSVDFTFNYSTDGMGDLKANMDVSSREGGLNTKNLSLATQEDANAAIDKIDNAINKVSMVRATFGATQNRLEHKIENLTTTNENLTEAESSIRDTDMASEMLNYTKYNVLQQAAQSMLAQANQQPQSILQLLG